MQYFIRLAALFCLLGLSTCHSSPSEGAPNTGITAITSGYIQLNNGQSFALPFAGQEQVARVFLVRHAEKAEGADPGLTPEGEKRALLLANIFRDFPLDAVYSTDYKRTRETAKPVAQDKGLDIQFYDANQLDTFSDQLRHNHQGEAVLVVGHSNTTPNLVNQLLGGEVLQQIDERDYSNFYVVAINEEGEKEVLQLKFGEIWVE